MNAPAPPFLQAAAAPPTKVEERFEQAKNPAGLPQFLQIVAKPKRGAARGKPEPKLTRVAFKVSRLMEFCSERELQNQTGHSVDEWPLVVAKELIDNALDACEEAEVAPEITVCVGRTHVGEAAEAGAIIIQDNAAGIDAETIESVLDYMVRVSSREAYVSPTRGAQGNALKTILAMGFVLDRGNADDRAGVTIVEARGVRHQIEFRVDHINNRPKIVHTTAPSPVEVGTKFTIHWPAPRLLENAKHEFQQLVGTYAWLNPHLSLRGVWFGREFIDVKATNPGWEKWRPRNPTSAHWYDEARLEGYLAAHVARDRDLGQHRTVREFIAEFCGFAGTAVQRKILAEVGCSHQSLAGVLRRREGQSRRRRQALGGDEEVQQAGQSRPSRRHRRRPSETAVPGAGRQSRHLQVSAAQGHERRRHGIPYVVEFAFGLNQAGLTQGGAHVARKFVTGSNFSAAISNPFRRFGSTGEGLECTLAKVRANANRPVICALHLASARIQFADRGKSSIILTDDAEQPDD